TDGQRCGAPDRGSRTSVRQYPPRNRASQTQASKATPATISAMIDSTGPLVHEKVGPAYRRAHPRGFRQRRSGKLRDSDTARLVTRVRPGDPDAQHARVVRGADRVGRHVRRQAERAAEGAVAHLAQAASGTVLAVLAPLVAALTAHHELSAVHLDGD